MIEGGISGFKDKRVLLLQGPVGPFFHRLAKDLKHAGAHVEKVNFNGGDWIFYPFGANNFRGRMATWPDYFETLLEQLHIDVVILFGDCRPIHQIAHNIATRRGLEIGVFEEGYIRPDFITFERFGVNDHSLIPRFPEFYLNNTITTIEPTEPVGNTYWYCVMWAMLYYFAAGLLMPIFLHYRHHRPLNWLEALPWVRSIWRKVYFGFRTRGTLVHLTGTMHGCYFLAPLQVHNDAQVHVHSAFDSVNHFIETVTTSFAQHAPLDTILVIKHHPMDRGYHNYSTLIDQQINKTGLQGRCLYIHDQHLPTLLHHARGVVVINSTVGLSALHQKIPLKVCGNAIFDMKNLTFQGALDDFWKNAPLYKPDNLLLQSFNSYLVRYTQLNGSFYKRMANEPTATGLRWSSKQGDSAKSLHDSSDSVQRDR